jgi:prepilin-type N-terminal cleavage/methylation domain-containing protein
MTMRPHQVPARRRGFTIIELLVVMVLLGLVMTTLTAILVDQERFYRGQREIVDVRTQLRQIVGVLPLDLRGVSSVGGDIYSMTDTSIDFRATLGSAVLCAANGATLMIPPLATAKLNTLTTWNTMPVANDSIFVLDKGSGVGALDDQWKTGKLASIATAKGITGCKTSTGLVQVADTGQSSYSLSVAPGVSKTVIQGDPIRFFRHVHYSLYKATDGKWYLGYYDCITLRNPACNPIQPVGGPYLSYTNSGPGTTSGLTFAYYDSTNVVTVDRLKVAKIKITVRGQSQSAISVPGAATGSTGLYSDSLSITVALRNRT